MTNSSTISMVLFQQIASRGGNGADEIVRVVWMLRANSMDPRDAHKAFLAATARSAQGGNTNGACAEPTGG